MLIFQKTLKSKIKFNGIGLHNGKKVEITLQPETEDSGINFYFNKKCFKANWKNAFVNKLCTKLKNGSTFISTIEHLMSALSGIGITNLKIEISSDELPILDGSSKEYLEKILESGLKVQKKKIKILKVKKKLEIRFEDKFIILEPTKNERLEIHYSIDYKDDYIKKQKIKYFHSYEEYLNIYEARTFCLHKDLEMIFSMGLAKGGSLDNAIVVSGNKILNQGGLRYKNEFVKHKVLDCVGDLYLAEYPIHGKIITHGGGHELNILILKKLFSDKNNYELVSY